MIHLSSKLPLPPFNRKYASLISSPFLFTDFHTSFFYKFIPCFQHICPCALFPLHCTFFLIIPPFNLCVFLFTFSGPHNSFALSITTCLIHSQICSTSMTSSHFKILLSRAYENSSVLKSISPPVQFFTI